MQAEHASSEPKLHGAAINDPATFDSSNVQILEVDNNLGFGNCQCPNYCLSPTIISPSIAKS
ncbi:hypothetical protein CY34DRAFT_802176 [Suillus luteus UH-Slu-Lm8-n1]|uniref:Uncharacterized protein n=1 Tax=Suillus luteus UH-Slu-Lm8-n1 TaxID=930992 RepID=A0A0D0BP63_9AGAM|nr:hypothetical protein CY34DRAFT_802176 [Suillus luteus UH-Slu-Lm8-n1]